MTVAITDRLADEWIKYYKMQVKAAECSTELDESECTTGEQLESKSPWKDFWDEELILG